MSTGAPVKLAAPQAPAKKKNVILQNSWNFIVGAVAGSTATSCIQPLDMVKTRMQLRSESKGKLSYLSVARDLYRNEGGVTAFYKGLGSALMRQVLYAALRLGMFYTIMDVAKDKWNHSLTTFEKAEASLSTGAIAAFVATPFDLALIRFQADGALPMDQRRNYKNWYDALSKIVKKEGFFKLWKGALPTICRAMSINFGMLVPYEECKVRLKPYVGEGYGLYIGSSFLAGFCAAFLSLPFDNMKTKIQKMKAGPDGKLPYSGFADCFLKTLRKEGLRRFWVGFPIFYMRVGCHAMITLLVSDTLKFFIRGKRQ